MTSKKIFVFLPDGVGLRNFAYSDFYKTGINENFEIVFWNNTPFPLSELGFNEIKIENPKTHPLTDSYKNIKIQAELNVNIKKTKDNVYDSYRFPFKFSNLKETIKNSFVIALTPFYSSEKGLQKLRHKINKLERETAYYKQSKSILEKENPAFIFCTNQRPMVAIAPLLAAKDLGIPTATFIFSWDNLPKATLVVSTDFYFVWSEHMKSEMQLYYPQIPANKIIVTGTPQFEAHFEKKNGWSKDDFFSQNNLDINKKYICYSGDDETTCPDDPQYLEDVAKAVLKLNQNGYNLGIIFRRCPVDFSSRYDAVLEKFKEIIVPIVPLWTKKGDFWNTILPIPEDIVLQINTIAHSEMIINLGSSMVFDAVTHHKPCAYINYDVVNKKIQNWSVKKIYNFVHFKSMPNKNAVLWLNDASEIETKIKAIIDGDPFSLQAAQEWFVKINHPQPELASRRIWYAIKTILLSLKNK
jgi:hypothetical protein